MLKTEEEWLQTASNHWDYIEEVIRYHHKDVTPRIIRNCKRFYLKGMVDGYNDEKEAAHWVDILAKYDGIVKTKEFLKDDKGDYIYDDDDKKVEVKTDAVTFFHYRTAYKHGKKHRLDDLNLTCLCNEGCTDDTKPLDNAKEVVVNTESKVYRGVDDIIVTEDNQE
jgi:hypothetical protein